MRLQGDGTGRDRLNQNILVRSLLPAGSIPEERSIRLHDGWCFPAQSKGFLRQKSQRRDSECYDGDVAAGGKESG